MNMNSIHFEPWRRVHHLRHELDRLFESYGTDNDQSSVATSDWIPAVDITEQKDRYLLSADIPGVDPKDIEIIAESGILAIRGNRVDERPETQAGYSRAERPRGSFHRRFSLPDTADLAQITARSAHGVLEITIPKLMHTVSRSIKVEG